MTRALFPRKSAAVFTPATTHPMVDDFSLRAARYEARRNPTAQPVTPIEARQGPWSGYPQLGIEVPFAPAENNQQTILKLDEWGMPQTWTVALGLAHSQVTDVGFDVTARIFFGSGGATQQVDIDWLLGTSIVLPMNAVNVVALYNQVSRSAPNIPDDLRLRVTLARGDNHSSRPTLTYPIQVGTAGAVFAIPAFARDFLIMPRNADAVSYTNFAVEFLSGATTPVRLQTIPMTQFLTFFEPTLPIIGAYKSVPIPAFARFVQVVSYPGGVPANLPCTMQFAIGV